MHEISSTVFVAPPKDDAFEAGTQMERRFSASPRSSGFRKSCSGEGASSIRGDTDNQQRSSLKASIHSKGKEKLRKSSNIEDRVGSKGFEGFIHRDSSVMVFPSSPVTREKMLNSVGTCGMMVAENIELTCLNQMSKGINSLKTMPSMPIKAPNLVTISQGDAEFFLVGGFQIEGLSSSKMAKVREVLSSLDIKVYSRWKNRGLGSRKKRRVVKDFLQLENPNVVMFQETKREVCDRRFVGSVWSVRNKEWATLPACGALGGILIIWDSNKLSNEEVHFFPHSLQEVLPRWTSDHWLMVLDTNPFKWGPTPFRFENMWLQHPSFKDCFSSWWRGFQGNGWEGHKFMRNEIANIDAVEQEGVLSLELSAQRALRKGELEELILREESASRLDSPFTEEEISKAIFQLDRDKASEPDGFIIAGFQDCWDVIKEDLVRVFAEFYRSGIINQSTNATFIVLLPKRSQTKKISDFRPISLITCLYKIIAKVLSGQLRGVLHETIHSNQGAFVQGRQILNAVLIANEIVDEKRQSEEKGQSSKLTLKRLTTM
ncbi:hypothetical protein AAG906_038514 [Vitis piasezkii]